MKAGNEKNWAKQSPYDRFLNFIALNVDRFKILLQTVEKLSLNSTVITISDNRHFFIFPQTQNIQRTLASGSFPFSGKHPYIFTAHYDRVEGSSGANDNSIAVFHLLRAAMEFNLRNIDNWIIIFTDKEELALGENLEIQGAYTLGQKLKTWGLEKARIYNFDACGTGDTFIFSTITDSVLGNNELPNINKLRTEIRQLRNHALDTANQLRMEKFFLAPTPFSDDIGFLRAGFAAQTITLLPAEEASKYEEVLRKNPEFSNLIITGKIKTQPERRFLPTTWKNINTPADNHQRLTPKFYDQIVNFIINLCR